ncbi:MAG: CCA tRNA nucleotidyltransferase [Eubacterium sp.]|nr:CCA tRNA nucleotidyltransferase [Eubacterium sp.]
MYLPRDAKRIISLLTQSQYKAYAVGGCVRDAIMGRKVSDYDITTSALPNQVEKVLLDNDIKFVETGLKHGTITAIINHQPYEITTFRTDGKYSDNRHPESVSFVNDINEDLSRRDFTINAIAYNDEEGFIDLFGGVEDIKKRIIKTVGKSDLRFQEDALRIMRALRFSSQLSFGIEEETRLAIFKNKELLNNIAAERIYSELVKLLIGDNAGSVIKEYSEIISVIIPEYKECDYNAIAVAPKKDYIRLAILLLKTDNADGILKRLRVSNDTFDKVTKLIEYSRSDASVKELLNKLGVDLLFDLIELKKAINSSFETEKIREEATRIIESKEPYRISDLKINGNDLMALGFEGKEISSVLEKLLFEVWNNPEKNKKEILLNIASRFISRKI